MPHKSLSEHCTTKTCALNVDNSVSLQISFSVFFLHVMVKLLHHCKLHYFTIQFFLKINLETGVQGYPGQHYGQQLWVKRLMYECSIQYHQFVGQWLRICPNPCFQGDCGPHECYVTFLFNKKLKMIVSVCRYWLQLCCTSNKSGSVITCSEV